jgi:membrane-bound lytic murein transglycosylase D
MNTDPGKSTRKASIARLFGDGGRRNRSKAPKFGEKPELPFIRTLGTRLFQLGLLFLAGALAFAPLIGERMAPLVGSWFESEALVPESEESFALGAIPSELAPILPIDFNDRVEKWINRFLTSHRADFEVYLAREGLYGDMIREKLRSRGMPEDLIYLALVESGFLYRARSSVAAIGVWQFMGPTAEAMGLTIDNYVDERRDPVRATDAALDYLQELHDRFGSWYLATAAYNAGPNRVARVLQVHAESRTGEEALYWEIIDHLPNETREHVPKMLAAALLGREAQHFNIEVERASPYRFDRVLVPGGTPLTELAKALDLPLAAVRDLNPHLIGGVVPPGVAYPVRVPPGESDRVVAMLPQGSRRAD